MTIQNLVPSQSEEMIADDCSEITNRLYDKILSAFKHAYATGEIKIAKRLHQLLIDEKAEDASQTETHGSYNPLRQAERWIQFIEARNQYNWVCENQGSRPGAVERAQEAMKEAYRRLSHA